MTQGSHFPQPEPQHSWIFCNSFSVLTFHLFTCNARTRFSWRSLGSAAENVKLIFNALNVPPAIKSLVLAAVDNVGSEQRCLPVLTGHIVRLLHLKLNIVLTDTHLRICISQLLYHECKLSLEYTSLINTESYQMRWIGHAHIYIFSLQRWIKGALCKLATTTTTTHWLSYCTSTVALLYVLYGLNLFIMTSKSIRLGIIEDFWMSETVIFLQTQENEELTHNFHSLTSCGKEGHWSFQLPVRLWVQIK